MSLQQALHTALFAPLGRALTDPGVGGGAFDPASIYVGGVLGGWYDPSVTATLDQSRIDPIVPVTASGQVVGRIYDRSGNANTATSGTDARRAAYTEGGGIRWLELDGSDDGYVTAAGGGASTGFLIVVAFRCDTMAANQVLFDNRSGNTGFQLSVNSANTRIDANFWNGTTAIGNATSNGSVVAGTDYVVAFWYDGTNSRIQVNSTTVAVSASGVLSAGPAALGIGRTIGGASYLDGRFYGLVYVKDAQPSATVREQVKFYLAAKAAVTL